MIKRIRDAITGRFTTHAHATAHPDTTVEESVEPYPTGTAFWTLRISAGEVHVNGEVYKLGPEDAVALSTFLQWLHTRRHEHGLID